MARDRSFYFTVWRWHFYAGLFSIPFLLLLSVTGAAYLFRVEVEEWLYHDLLHVPASSTKRLTHEQIAASVERAFPGAAIASYVPAFALDESAKVRIGAGSDHNHSGVSRTQEVFVNPYTGAVLGTQVPDDRLMQRIKRLHGRLLLGDTGKAIVELASGWMFVLLVTGFYLWFPRANWSVWGTFLPHLRSGKRIALRDLHAVGAVYLSFGLCFQILSGQPWTLLSSKVIRRLADSSTEGPLIARADRFQSQPPSSPAGSAQDWLGDSSAVSAPHVHSAHAAHFERLTLDQVAAIAERQKIVAPYQIALPKGPTGVYSVRSLSTDPRDTVYLHVDQYSGAVLASVPFSGLNPLAKTIGVGIAVHEGRMFGRLNQMLGLLVAGGSFFIAAMGASLWWSRRPKGKVGGPVLRPGAEVPRGALWVAGLLAVVFPFVGLSMLLMWARSRILRRHDASVAQH